MEEFKFKNDLTGFNIDVTGFPKVLGSDDKGKKVSIVDVINRTSTLDYQNLVSRVPVIKDKKTRDRYKKKFGCIVTAAILQGGAGHEHIVEWTNLLMIDTDFLNSDDAKKYFPTIANVLGTHLIYQRFSISLTGVHTLILINDPKKREEYLDLINKKFKSEFGFEIDLKFKNPVQKAILSSGKDQILNDSPIPFDGTFSVTVVTSEKKSVKQRISDGAKKKKENPYVAAVKYLSGRYTVVRDIMSGKITVNGQILTENIVSTMIMDAALNGYFANKDFISTWLNSNYVKVEHRFDEFVKKYSHLKPIGNITKLAQSLVVDSVPKSYPNFVEDTLTLWLVKLVAQLFERKANDIAIFLVGPQNIGKSSFYQYLLPLELRDLYVEAAFKSDREYKSLLIKYVLVVDDELKSRVQDIDFVKSTLTNPWVNLRKLYVQDDYNYPRIASFGGTSNDPQLLTDPSGNRRFCIFLVSKILRERYESVDKVALFIEAYHLYKSGFDLETPDELVKAIQENSHQFEAFSIAEELLIEYYPPADIEKDHKQDWHWWPVHQIVKMVNDGRASRVKDYHIGLALKKLKYQTKYMQVGNSKLKVYAVKPSQGGDYDPFGNVGHEIPPPPFF